MSSHHTSSNLDALLDQLCENQLDESSCRQLEQQVLADPEARRRYVEYIQLHGALIWDAAHGDGPSQDFVPPQETAGIPVPLATSAQQSTASERRSHTRVLISAVAVAAVAAIGLLWAFPGNNVDDSAENSGGATAGNTVEPQPGHPNPDNSNERAADRPPLKLDQLIGQDGPRDKRGESAVDPGTQHVQPGVQLTQLPIDEFIDIQLAQYWSVQQYVPAAEASDEEWMRRAYLDIAGHIPPPAAVIAFLDDDRPDKRSRLIDELLDQPDYVRHFSTVWTNLLIGRREHIGVSRPALQKYLRDSFRTNKPWKDIVVELVSAEGRATENGASNFLLAHLNNQAVPATAITARLFLGREVLCIQCHAHPSNNSQQNEFWELNGFFKQTVRVDRRVRDPRGGKSLVVAELVNRPVGGPTFYENRREVVKMALPSFRGETIDAGPDVNRRAELARLMTQKGQQEIAESFVNRVWQHFFGYAFTRNVDDMGPHAERSHPALLARLAQEFIDSNYDTKRLIRWICNSRAYQLSSEIHSGNLGDEPAVSGELPAFSRMYLKSLSPEQVYDSLLIATAADRSRRRDDLFDLSTRDAWVRQFIDDRENDENEEANRFDGSVGQALLMMNGSLVNRMLKSSESPLLRELLTQRTSDRDRIDMLCLATLSRRATEAEAAALQKHLQDSRRRAAQTGLASGLEDVLWVYLNSSEFIYVH